MERVIIVVMALAGAYIFTNQEKKIHIYPTHLNTSYDYIVVGAGSAGAVVATRLSEDPDVSVLLIEAGGEELDNPDISIPAAFYDLRGSEQDWRYFTEPQEHAMFGMKERRSFWPRGRILGGSSSINALQFVRGSRHDYDSWAMEGCDGWSYKDVLPYFLKLEDNKIKSLKESKYHSAGGPLQITDHVVTPMAEVFLKAGIEMGYDVIDCNGKDQIGFCRVHGTVTTNGQRVSTASHYLRPSMEGSNIHISINTFATKIIFDNFTATGVEIIKQLKKSKILARREIILSAGALNSLQLLMLSGIGPRKHLEELKIPVISDLLVGQNLQDHLMFPREHIINVTYSANSETLKSTWTKL